MNTRTFEVILRAREPHVSGNASIAAARLISLLPSGWRGRLDSLIDAAVVVVETTSPMSVDTVVAAAETALSDTSMRDWKLGGCTAL